MPHYTLSYRVSQELRRAGYSHKNAKFVDAPMHVLRRSACCTCKKPIGWGSLALELEGGNPSGRVFRLHHATCIRGLVEYRHRLRTVLEGKRERLTRELVATDVDFERLEPEQPVPASVQEKQNPNLSSATETPR